MKLCAPCKAVTESPISLTPTWLVHPEHGKLMIFDVRLEAVCPTCGTRWRRGTDNNVAIVAH